MSDEVEVQEPSAGLVETVAPPTTTEVDEALAPPSGDAQPLETAEALSTEAEVEEELDLEQVPESSGDFPKYKPLFKENPELRAILGREKAYSEIAPSFSEFKGIMERIPTLDDAEKLANDAQNLRTLGQTYRSDPVGFTESLRESDPFAFTQFAKQLPQVLAETAPDLYSEQARFYSNAVLDNLFVRAQQSQNQDAILSLQNVAAMLGVQLGAPRVQPQGNSEVEKLRKQLAERNQSDAQAKAESFWDGANSEYTQAATTEIESLIKKSWPAVTDAQLRRMSNEVWEGVNERLSQQPQTMAQINAFKAAVARGGMGSSDHRSIVDFSTRRAKQMIPLVWKEISAEWSKNIASVNRQQIDKRQGIAARTREAGTGQQPGSQVPARAPSNGNKKTFSSVFESLRNGTYRPTA